MREEPLAGDETVQQADEPLGVLVAPAVDNALSRDVGFVHGDVADRLRDLHPLSVARLVVELGYVPEVDGPVHHGEGAWALDVLELRLRDTERDARNLGVAGRRRHEQHLVEVVEQRGVRVRPPPHRLHHRGEHILAVGRSLTRDVPLGLLFVGDLRKVFDAAVERLHPLEFTTGLRDGARVRRSRVLLVGAKQRHDGSPILMHEGVDRVHGRARPCDPHGDVLVVDDLRR